MGNPTQITRRGAAAMGLAFIVFGVFPILSAFGVVTTHPAPGVVPWVAGVAGLVFVLAGCAVIVGYAIAPGVTPDGQLDPTTPFGVQLLQFLINIALITSLVMVFGWVAFGTGERHFTSTFSIPGISVSSRGSERSGRIAFGIATILGAWMAAAVIVNGTRRLIAARSGPR